MPARSLWNAKAQEQLWLLPTGWLGARGVHAGLQGSKVRVPFCVVCDGWQLRAQELRLWDRDHTAHNAYNPFYLDFPGKVWQALL